MAMDGMAWAISGVDLQVSGTVGMVRMGLGMGMGMCMDWFWFWFGWEVEIEQNRTDIDRMVGWYVGW